MTKCENVVNAGTLQLLPCLNGLPCWIARGALVHYWYERSILPQKDRFQAALGTPPIGPMQDVMIEYISISLGKRFL